MDYAQVITSIDRAPEGWLQRLSLGEYDALDDKARRYYEPLFARYRTKKVRDYDPDYGNFVGWRPIQVGVGEPIGYKYVGYIAAQAIDRIMDSNVLTARVLSRPKKWKK